MDYLQQLATQIGGKIRTQDLLNGNFQKKSLRSLIVKDYKQFKLQIDDYGSLCSIEVKVNSEIACAINNHDRVLYYNIPFNLESVPFTVYVSESNTDLLDNIRFRKACHSIGIFLKKINISPKESVFIYRNCICFAFRTNRDLEPILDGIIELINANSEIFKRTARKAISTKNIPDNLKPLAPLMRKYSLSDDSEREQLIEGMKKKEIKQLIESVDPYMGEINNYLNSFKKQPLSEEATLMGNLAELVTELKMNTTS